mmetsp:Transcript_5199/g.5331  ORF Transcript_5199/g.5331 Transcript_5199/m.5331 type:complete len:110 (+) Transcript_5199:616-945(+)|eukprot:CAMPEP_0170528846 /NCGR_PEP_ID=MMETSP0209-20121228/14285_1 /TAXON_ID=665100 ORGANISM="Litonotus pictus, Strain P1" /NCGR_SAMPLE_ID=MMETSP0209 /ASSEMBLY_ACC=CAM_ASM_000301 /LENGTH=109 /DNA_ID=CAMNT_0010820259 /DNA_START=514 /DNA_END=843 /DNA_ORIENTATION=+
MAKKTTKATKQPATKVAKKDTTGTKKRKTKKDKDPNAPKRACSAYILYSQSRRAALLKEQPKLNYKEVISALSKEWNGLSDAEKGPFNKQADVDKARYKKEADAYKKKK